MQSKNGSDFQIVTGKRKLRRKGQNMSVSFQELKNINDIDEEKSVIIRRLNSIRNEISITDFYSEAKNLIRELITSNYSGEIKKIVCFGLGSFSITSLHQLAFILEIQKYFKIPQIEFHDPIFNETEKQILHKFGCEVSKENCEGKYQIESLTLCYLPHCPKQLTNNLLWKNWNETHLTQTILMSNSFENLIENTPERFLKQDAEYILKISKYAQEYEINNNYQFSDVFNDTSIHIFSKNKLKEVPETFWKRNNKPPEYCDAELITKELEMKLKC